LFQAAILAIAEKEESRRKNKGRVPLEGIPSLLARLNEMMDREDAARILMEQAEIDSLQSQINPHFLYNTLESIRGQAIVEGVDEIADMIEALSAFFRYSVSQRGRLVTLTEELKTVENYLLIQRFRFRKKIQLVLSLEEGEDLLKFTLPKLTIQPIVENAIYHGLEAKLGDGEIRIRVLVTEKRLIVHVVDDGVGMEKTKLDALNESFRSGKHSSPAGDRTSSRGIALANVNRRIKLNYGDSFGLVIYSTPDVGTDVEIVLPLIKEQSPFP
jgi:two-component system sensor histidine kinase YesM